MTPAKTVYDRLMWDPRLLPGAFFIGYRDRLAPDGIRETPVVWWEPDGDVPWHRIRYFRCRDTVVWDRDSGLDRFATDELPPAAWKPSA